MRESSVQGAAIDAAEADGWFVRLVAWRGKRNAPDVIFIKDGRHVWIEFKRPREVPRLGQAKEIERMRAAGAEVYSFDSLADALRCLEIFEDF